MNLCAIAVFKKENKYFYTQMFLKAPESMMIDIMANTKLRKKEDSSTEKTP